MDQLDVSIIIVNWNTKQLLHNCIESIYEQAGDVDYEIIVVDNGSTDGSAEMVKNEFPEAILLENSRNRGFAAANNQAIAIASGKYVFLLNSDTIILEGAIEKLKFFADSYPEVAVVGPRVLNPDGTHQLSCFMFPSILNMLLSVTYLYKVFPHSRFFGRERMTWWDRSITREVEVVSGCAMFVRREAFEQVGVMDATFFMYAEETDWCYRFKKSGWKVVFAPLAEITHFGGQSTSQRPAAMTVELRKSILKFVKNHQGSTAYLIARFLTAFFFAIRLPVWSAAALLRPHRRGEATIKIRAYATGIKDVLFSQLDA